METITAYFEHGLLFKLSPSEQCNQYEARYIVSDGIRYDLENSSDVEKIHIPNFKAIDGFPNISHSLDYILKRKAGNLSKKGLFEPSIACLRKSNQLMSYSPIRWSKKDYFYIVIELTKAGKFEEAKKEKRFIEEHYRESYSFQVMHNSCLQNVLNNANKLKTDLVESDNPPNCDEACGKYRKRIYSLTGKDPRFPVMTNTILNSGLLFYPFIYGISKPKYCTMDEIIPFNNRPFIDDRTEEEKENYILYNKQRILEDRKATDFLEYCQICQLLPAFKPKNFKLYQEIKFQNEERFQNLMQISEEAGIDIEL